LDWKDHEKKHEEEVDELTKNTMDPLVNKPDAEYDDGVKITFVKFKDEEGEP
jgi:hypothetical protein